MARPLHHPAIDEITLDGVLFALTDPTRRAILAKLLQAGSMNCCQASGTLPPSTMSHHF